MKSPKIVVLGGGTGSFNLLSSLKNYASEITAIVNMSDNGGSTGILRDEFGVLPPGDVRQCLVALSGSPKIRQVFDFRFPDGELSGHALGNLFLSAIELNSKDFNEAIQIAGEVLNIKGNVVPVSLDPCELVYQSPGGNEVFGENNIEKTNIQKLQKPKIYYKNNAALNPNAKAAILSADMVVFAPGSLYTSLVPLLLVNGLSEALKNSQAKIIYIANLINKPLETADFSVDDYVQELERFGYRGMVDYVLYNTTSPDPKKLAPYLKEGEKPVIFKESKNTSYEGLGGNFLSESFIKPAKNDSLKHIRSLIRHNGDAVSKAIMKLYYS